MDQDFAEPGGEAEVHCGEDTVGKQDDDVGGDCEYDGISFVVEVESYDGAADPCGWGVCTFGPGIVGRIGPGGAGGFGGDWRT